jgi:hypothetical protein
MRVVAIAIVGLTSGLAGYGAGYLVEMVRHAATLDARIAIASARYQRDLRGIGEGGLVDDPDCRTDLAKSFVENHFGSNRVGVYCTRPDAPDRTDGGGYVLSRNGTVEIVVFPYWQSRTIGS